MIIESPVVIAALLRQAYLGDKKPGIAWHGPSVREVLRDVEVGDALYRPLPDRHNIFELVLHMAQWDEICARRLSGGRIDMTTGSPGDWPAIDDDTQHGWTAALQRLRHAQENLVKVVAQLRQERLHEQTPGHDWTNYLMIHGTLHHDLYHTGQIALLRRR